MGKLNIAHHKSYHPYRRDNIERVRRDEEEARQRDAVEEGRMMLADSEARIDLLRQRAGLLHGSKPRKDKDRDDVDAQIARAREKADEAESEAAAAAAAPGPSTLTSRTGHINFFEDLEQQGMATMAIPVRSTKRAPPPEETERGVALAPSAKDLNPWYSSDRNRDRDRDRGAGAEPDGEEDKRRRDLARKSVHDPLTAINTQLASRDARPSSASLPSRARAHPTASRPGPSTGRDGDGDRGGGGDGSGVGSGSGAASASANGSASASAERTSRESAERLRALELVRRRKRELGGGGGGGETPSTVRGGRPTAGAGEEYGYGDVFNRRAVEEAHRGKTQARRGDRDRDRDRDRDGRDGGRGRDWDRRGAGGC
ncbi:hypothetical protein V8D89_008762 [Ganoderma adspersum]